MSYDLNLLKLQAGQTPENALEQQELIVIGELPAPAMSPQFMRARSQAAELLIERLPKGFAVSDSAEDGSLSVSEGPEVTWGLYVLLTTDHASVSVPYTHHGDRAREAIGLLERVAKTLESELGCTTHDPQLNRIVNWEADRGRMLEIYLSTISRMQSVNSSPPPLRRKWWQFWK